MGEKIYFDVQRPPVVPLILGVLSIIFDNLHLTILFYDLILISIFIVSIKKLSKKFTLDLNILFLSLLSSPLFLKYSLLIGTEILAFSFLLLSIYYLEEKPFMSGFFLSLATLTRYNFVIFTPLLLFNKNVRKIVFSLFSFSLPWISWLFFNWYYFSHPLYSFISSYALNVYFRSYINSSVNIFDFLDIKYFGILPIAYIFSGVYLYKRFKKSRQILGFLVITLVFIYTYISIPIKIERYLLPLVFPLAILLSSFKYEKKSIVLTVLGIFILFSFVFSLTSIHKAMNYYEIFMKDIKTVDEKVEDFVISSDWIYHYLDGKKSVPVSIFCYGYLDINKTCGNFVLFNNYYEDEKTVCKIKDEWVEYEENISRIHKLVRLKNTGCKRFIIEKEFIDDYLKEFEYKHGYNPFEEVCKRLFKISYFCSYPFLS